MTIPKHNEPTYALIVPASKRRLEAVIDCARRELDVVVDTWKVVGGTGNHAAVWDFDPAGATGHELALFVSKLVAGTIYLAQRHESMYGSTVYEGVAATLEVTEPPKEIAQRLGDSFPESPRNGSSVRPCLDRLHR